MAKRKVTILAIAQAVGMSRNTVSKALNGDPSVTEKTRDLVISKAKEMHYKGMIPETNVPSSTDIKSKHIIFITRRFHNISPFWPLVWNGVESKVSQENHSFSISMVSTDDIDTLQLPSILNTQTIDGIICAEIFDKNYIRALVETGLPIVLIDSYFDPSDIHAEFDTVMMENSQSFSVMTQHLMDLGHKKIGFVGKFNYCRSFFERYTGYNQAFSYNNLIPPHQFSIVPDEDQYEVEWIIEKLKSFKEMPTALVCANDFIAINVIKAAKIMGLNLPKDLSVIGFDNLNEATTIEPHLSTVNISKEALGYRAVEILLWRMENRDLPFEVTHIENEIIFRDSTAPAPF